MQRLVQACLTHAVLAQLLPLQQAPEKYVHPGGCMATAVSGVAAIAVDGVATTT
eukprot:CAMPEP_0202411386 /NCGR_PEP_ID=MMETSP1128-20130828/21797_1 /ASSEMBLY_ACC=CAM_ASM_000463 /TAXON_ID=3047 /ORGANISM="Dunaliella tertiolecta, Strain CCMP1320" /LENGTH=53 /DNA_ID=CAMNT_0049017083 /DNA_START=345 /DNA_END=503 /DNA_ORIENTATION=-